MEALIEPEPDDAERRAILVALEAVADAEPSVDPYRSGWREAGILEGVDDAPEGG